MKKTFVLPWPFAIGIENLTTILLTIPNPDHQWVGELQAGLKIRPWVLVGGNSTVSTSRKCHLSCYHCSNLRTQELQFILFIPFALYLYHLSCIVPILGNWGARRKPDLSCKQEPAALKLAYPFCWRHCSIYSRQRTNE